MEFAEILSTRINLTISFPPLEQDKILNNYRFLFKSTKNLQRAIFNLRGNIHKNTFKETHSSYYFIQHARWTTYKKYNISNDKNKKNINSNKYNNNIDKNRLLILPTSFIHFVTMVMIFLHRVTIGADMCNLLLLSDGGIHLWFWSLLYCCKHLGCDRSV